MTEIDVHQTLDKIKRHAQAFADVSGATDLAPVSRLIGQWCDEALAEIERLTAIVERLTPQPMESHNGTFYTDDTYLFIMPVEGKHETIREYHLVGVADDEDRLRFVDMYGEDWGLDHKDAESYIRNPRFPSPAEEARDAE